MRNHWVLCGSFFKAHGQNVPWGKEFVQVQCVDPAPESGKLLHQDGQCPIDRLRLIDQHGGVCRPVKAAAEFFLQPEQFCIVVGCYEQNISPGKNADVIERDLKGSSLCGKLLQQRCQFVLFVCGKSPQRDVLWSRHHNPPIHTVRCWP